jgi:large repetitive protein
MDVMRFRPASLVVAGLVAVLSGCVGKYQSDFPVIVVNRTPNTIAVIANGREIGQVASGQTGNFSINTQETNANVFSNGVAPTPQAEVVFSARDMKTGMISTTKSVTLAQSPPTYVTFNTSDFPMVVRTVASFTCSPTTVGLNQNVFCNASGSTGSNLTYAWTFGDGTADTGVIVTHQYSQTGTFTIVLTVTSDNLSTNSLNRSVTVTASLTPAAANFTFSPATPAINQDVLFTVTTPTPGGTYTWDFGDGTPNGSAATLTHRFSRAALFNVTLRVTNAVGQSASLARPVNVVGAPVGTVNFTFSPIDPGINDVVFFNASTTTVVNATTFSWDFGDGARGAGTTTSHQYTQARTFTVTLTVTNDLGLSASLSKTVPVSSSTGLSADFTYSPTDPSISLRTNSVIFDATPSSASATGWTWDFGDNTATASGQRVTHTFSNPGTWVVRLTVTDATGRSATITKSVTVRS